MAVVGVKDLKNDLVIYTLGPVSVTTLSRTGSNKSKPDLQHVHPRDAFSKKMDEQT